MSSVPGATDAAARRDAVALAASEPSSGGSASQPILSIRDLTVQFSGEVGTVLATVGVSYDLFAGETLGIVGESGSGKTVSVLAALGLLPQPPASILSGEAWFDGCQLIGLDPVELRSLRGAGIGLVFQDAAASLNPVFTIGQQIVSALRAHDPAVSRQAAKARAGELLRSVGLPQPERRVDQYPNQLSGGMRQRSMIALAVANQPSVLVADEPTTALDVTVQAQVLDTLVEAQQQSGSSMILITHDLGVIAERADRVAVMYAGRVVEVAATDDLLLRPAHPYLAALLDSMPSLEGSTEPLRPISGAPPTLHEEPTGCSFRPRCSLCRGRAVCGTIMPELRLIGPGHTAACHFAEEMPGWATSGAVGAAMREDPTVPPVVGRAARDRARSDERGSPAAVESSNAIEAAVEPASAEHAPGRRVGVHEGLADVPAALAMPVGAGVLPAADERGEVLSVVGLTKRFGMRRWRTARGGELRAVDGVDLHLVAGETLGLVGESGCGKSTLAQCIMRLDRPTSGRILYGGVDVTDWNRRRLRAVRSHAQIVFQDPYSSLNPRAPVREIIAEPLRVQGMRGQQIDRRVAAALEQVGLNKAMARRYPYQFSGGQRQRIAIARALILTPKVVVLDEPVSSLDVSAQAQIIGLLEDLKASFGLSLLFISHDLSIVRYLADRVAVMYLGRIVELGTGIEVFARPAHPYTTALLSAVPKLRAPSAGSRTRIVLAGEPPDPTNLPSGCRFRTRCWKVQPRCAADDPELTAVDRGGHAVACHFPET